MSDEPRKKRPWVRRLPGERRQYKDAVSHKRWRESVRERLFDVYGHVCSICGFADKRALQLDHVKGDGAEERKTKFVNGSRVNGRCTMSIYMDAIRNPDHERYRVLCANCNWIHRVENGLIRKRTQLDHRFENDPDEGRV